MYSQFKYQTSYIFWMVGICPGGIWHGGLLSSGYMSGGICPGGICPGGICPRTVCFVYNQHLTLLFMYVRLQYNRQKVFSGSSHYL